MGFMQGVLEGVLIRLMMWLRKSRFIFILKRHSMRAMTGRKMKIVMKTMTLVMMMTG